MTALPGFQAICDRQTMPVMQEEGAPEASAQWGSLPREVLALVFLSLPLKDRQAPLPRRCRQWRPDSHPACAASPAATPAPCGGWRRRLWPAAAWSLRQPPVQKYTTSAKFVPNPPGCAGAVLWGRCARGGGRCCWREPCSTTLTSAGCPCSLRCCTFGLVGRCVLPLLPDAGAVAMHAQLGANAKCLLAAAGRF
jgi:hypothetical protein